MKKHFFILLTISISTFFLMGCGVDEYQKAAYQKGYKSGYAYEKKPCFSFGEFSKGYENGREEKKEKYSYEVCVWIYEEGYYAGRNGKTFQNPYINDPFQAHLYKVGFEDGKKNKEPTYGTR